MWLKKSKRWISRSIQKLLQPPIMIVPDEQKKMPGAFIISAPRSGSTLLRYIFDTHSDIAAPPETHIFTNLLSVLDDEVVLNAMWHLGFHRDALAQSLGDCGRKFLEAYAVSKGKKFWVEKTPRYVEIVDKIHEAFPDVKFIMLYRHPFDIVRSMMDREMISQKPGYNHYSSALAGTSAFVAECHLNMLQFQKKHPRVTHEIRYEALVLEPEATLRSACDFLEMPFNNSMISFNEMPHDMGRGDEKIYNTDGIHARIRTFEHWSDKELATAKQFLSENLKLLGYAA